MNRIQRGFTLVELMVVVAIIAILAAIALPLYLNMTARAQSSEALTLAGGLKAPLVDYYNSHNSWPTGTPANASIGAASPASIAGRYVSQVEVKGAAIVATFGTHASQKLQGETLTLSPINHEGSIEWTCKVSSAAIYSMVPSNCRHGG